MDNLITELDYDKDDGTYWIYFVDRLHEPVSYITPSGKMLHIVAIDLAELTDDELLTLFSLQGQRRRKMGLEV